MFELIIKGNTPEELYDFMQELLHKRNTVVYPGKGVPGNLMPTAPVSVAPQTAHPGTPAHHTVPLTTPTGTATIAAIPVPAQAVTPAHADHAAMGNNQPAIPPTAAPTAPIGAAYPSNAAPPQAAPGVPQAPAPTYTLDQLARAGATLAQSGKMEDALALLARYGVQTVNQLKPEQYGTFATELRALGAQV